MAETKTSPQAQQSDFAPGYPRPDFPRELIGARILLATESLGPVNGVSRTTQSLVDYLRNNGANVATCAPRYKGQKIVESKAERQPLVNPEWVSKTIAKSSAQASRAIGGSWTFHYDRSESSNPETERLLQSSSQSKNTKMIRRSKSGDTRRHDGIKPVDENPEYRLQGWPLPYNPDLTVAYPFRLGKVYEKTFKPDVIYLASPASVGFQFLVQLWQLDNPPPTLLNFQTDLAAYAEILFPSPLDRYGVFLLGYVQGNLFRAPAVRTIFYPSDYVAKYMKAAGAPGQRMEKLGRGVNTELFNPGRCDEAYRKEVAPNGEIIFACICRIAPEKGFEFLAQAATKLAAQGLKFKLLIVGGNKNPAVMNEVKSYFTGLENQVIFTGMKFSEDLARQYAAADIFLHCSITETFGLVVLESMASGVPVIARAEGGPVETVKEGISGFLVPPHDLETFVSRALQLANDVCLRREMGESARAQALDTTWDKINNLVALRIAAAMNEAPQRLGGGFYGSWRNLVGCYFAVGIVWVFWFIAVIPMLVCGKIGVVFKKNK